MCHECVYSLVYFALFRHQSGHAGIADMLIENKADVTLKCVGVETIVLRVLEMQRASSTNGRCRAACVLRSPGSDTSPLFLACYAGHFGVVTVVLRGLKRRVKRNRKKLRKHVDCVQKSGALQI